MDLGTRNIRSSGAGSGSVEITLPAALRPLLGVACRITLRDGHRPEIVLTPDLRAAVHAFSQLWTRLAIAFGPETTPGSLPIGEFAVSLDPSEQREATGSLALVDGLALAGRGPHDRLALARTTAGLAFHLAGAIGIDKAFAAEFGEASAFIVTGLARSAATREICDIAGALLRPGGVEPGGSFARHGEDAFSPLLWRELAAPLQALATHVVAWSRNPIERTARGAAWRRGRALELRGQ